MMRHIAKWLLLVPVYGYRWLISPLTSGCCRFHPTCSQYTTEALHRHGTKRGAMMALRRIIACRPGGRSGYDPVPEQQP